MFCWKHLSFITALWNFPTQQPACVDWLSLCGIYCNLLARCISFSPQAPPTFLATMSSFFSFSRCKSLKVVGSTFWNCFPLLCNLVWRLRGSVLSHISLFHRTYQFTLHTKRRLSYQPKKTGDARAEEQQQLLLIVDTSGGCFIRIRWLFFILGEKNNSTEVMV